MGEIAHAHTRAVVMEGEQPDLHEEAGELVLRICPEVEVVLPPDAERWLQELTLAATDRERTWENASQVDSRSS